MHADARYVTSPRDITRPACMGSRTGVMTRVGPSRQHSHPLAGRPRSMALAQPRRIPVLVRGTSDFEPYPDRAPDATDAVNDEIEKLDIIVPDSLVKRFTVAAQA